MKTDTTNREILIWGLPPGETERWTEYLLACFPVTDKVKQNTEAVKNAARADGYHSFRIEYFVPGTRPDFAKAVQV